MPTDISREMVTQFIDQEGAQLVEVLSRDEYEWAHLPGARHISLSELDGRSQELDRGRPVIAYCNDFQ